jgi:hypothetical protein
MYRTAEGRESQAGDLGKGKLIWPQKGAKSTKTKCQSL